MTPRQQQLVRESFESIAPLAGPLASLFYGRLFAVNPALQPLFRIDIKEQGKKLMAMIHSCIESLGRFEQIRPHLREMGQRHAAYGVRSEHYPEVGNALLWSLGQALEAQFDKETREAWTALVAEISREMQAGASSHS